MKKVADSSRSDALGRSSSSCPSSSSCSLTPVERRTSSMTADNDEQLMSDEPVHRRRSGKLRPGFNIHKPMEDEDELRTTTSTSEAPSSVTSASMIDNSILVYIPMALRCGVTVQCRPDVLARCPQLLRLINADVEGCLEILPESVHALVRRTNIWVNTTYYYGPREKPRNVNHSTAHHHVGWLLWARDKPEKAHGIEIYNIFDYQRMRLHWNGLGLLLHELCHLIHQFALPDGLNNTAVKEAYDSAKSSGLYNTTLRRDWAGLHCDTDMAYALVNHKEFFSEMSVTYLSNSYCELDEEDCYSMERCSPPLMAPKVVERLRMSRRTVMPIDGAVPSSDCDRILRLPSLEESKLSERSNSRSSRGTVIPHCNKFYPFTRGQLRKHDPALHDTFDELWKHIESWVDDDDDSCLRCWWL